MKSRVHRATLFALYQLCIVIGIVAMPLAIVANQIGLTLPIHRVLANVGEAYENAQAQAQRSNAAPLLSEPILERRQRSSKSQKRR